MLLSPTNCSDDSDALELNKHLRDKVQTELRKMKDTWWQHKAAELQQYSDEHNFKRFFEGSKTVYMAPLSISSCPIFGWNPAYREV